MATDCEFRTQNLQLAAFIPAKGVADLPAISGEHGKLTFHFADPEEKLGWDVRLFDSDEPVPVKQLFLGMERIARPHVALCRRAPVDQEAALVRGLLLRLEAAQRQSLRLR